MVAFFIGNSMRKETLVLPWAMATALFLHALVFLGIYALDGSPAGGEKPSAQVAVWVTVVPRDPLEVGTSAQHFEDPRTPPKGKERAREEVLAPNFAPSRSSQGTAPHVPEQVPEEASEDVSGEARGSAAGSASEPSSGGGPPLQAEALAQACPPPFEIPERLRGQGFFPRLFEVTVRLEKSVPLDSQAVWEVVSLRPKESRLAFLDDSLERLVKSRCRFTTSLLRAGLDPAHSNLFAAGAPSDVSFWIEFF